MSDWPYREKVASLRHHLAEAARLADELGAVDHFIEITDLLNDTEFVTSGPTSKGDE